MKNVKDNVTTYKDEPNAVLVIPESSIALLYSTKKLESELYAWLQYQLVKEFLKVKINDDLPSSISQSAIVTLIRNDDIPTGGIELKLYVKDLR